MYCKIFKKNTIRVRILIYKFTLHTLDWNISSYNYIICNTYLYLFLSWCHSLQQKLKRPILANIDTPMVCWPFLTTWKTFPCCSKCEYLLSMCELCASYVRVFTFNVRVMCELCASIYFQFCHSKLSCIFAQCEILAGERIFDCKFSLEFGHFCYGMFSMAFK